MIGISELSNPRDIEREIPIIADLHQYWASLNGGQAPERASVDPVAIKSLLPHLLLVAFQFEPFRVSYRLTGTAIDSAAGFNLTGRSLDEFLVEPLKDGALQLLDAYERAATSGAPQIATYRWLRSWPAEYEVPYGIFPLAVNGRIMQALAIEQVCHLPPFKQGKTWHDWEVMEQAGGVSELDLMSYR
jgi:hypothetical protein